jgi:threonylcarbamoyladenosine tRNA methylthiotransferase MtaB
VPGVDLVVANSHKGQLEQLIRKYYSGELRDRIHKSNIFKKEDLEPGGGIEEGHTRSFLKIQDGCNSFCTFCVIPFARGKSRSLSIRDICARISELASGGVKEVVLTGVHIADYQDGDLGLDDLVERILRDTTIERLRLTSLEPLEVSDRLLGLFQRYQVPFLEAAHSRLCPHFHMSIQSANTKVLRDMKRRYTAEDVETSLRTINENVPGAFVGMDVIAGFPGESDEEFLDSFERLRRMPWTRLHVFPYSERPGTVAARLADGVERTAILKRAEMLRDLSAERLAASAASQVGSRKMGLGLKSGKLLTRDFWNVELDGGEVAVNSEIPLHILNVRGDTLIAQQTR